jgi:hypothetical protein
VNERHNLNSLRLANFLPFFIGRQGNHTDSQLQQEKDGINYQQDDNPVRLGQPHGRVDVGSSVQRALKGAEWMMADEARMIGAGSRMYER